MVKLAVPFRSGKPDVAGCNSDGLRNGLVGRWEQNSSGEPARGAVWLGD
jgi:hypothetical protein